MKIEILQITPDAEILIERIGRKCYNSELCITGNSHGKFIKHLLERGHESVLEHAVVTFDVDGVSRALSHQAVRHRVGVSFTQRSQRYCNEYNFDYVIPKSISNNEEAQKHYLSVMGEIQNGYDTLREFNIKPEDARMLLPNACKTTFSVTFNFRSLRHFLKLRCDHHAQWEIREMAMEMLRQVYDHAPNCFGDLWLKYGDKE